MVRVATGKNAFAKAWKRLFVLSFAVMGFLRTGQAGTLHVLCRIPNPKGLGKSSSGSETPMCSTNPIPIPFTRIPAGVPCFRISWRACTWSGPSAGTCRTSRRTTSKSAGQRKPMSFAPRVRSALRAFRPCAGATGKRAGRQCRGDVGVGRHSGPRHQ